MSHSLRSLFCAVFALTAVVPAWSQDAPPVYGAPITVARAAQLAAAAEAESRKSGWFIAIAVVDTAGNLVHFHRMDNTQSGSVNVAIGKARSAALFRRPTKVFQDLLAQGPAFQYLLALEGVAPIQGGLPVLVDGKVVGAVGISGGTGGEDSAVAEAALRALAAH